MDQQLDITKAVAIYGWMSEPELLWLADQASKHRCIVEIGSHLGRSTRAMLDNTQGIVYACDDWKGPRDVYIEDRKGLLHQFLDNIKPYFHDDKLRLMIGDHTAMREHLFHGVEPDMVFIDGSHETEDVARDVRFWKDRLLRGGLLCGHDWDFTSVRMAVGEVLGTVSVAEGTNIWWWRI